MIMYNIFFSIDKDRKTKKVAKILLLNLVKYNYCRNPYVYTFITDDHSRVILKGTDEVSADYTNANYISVSKCTSLITKIILC